MKLIPLMFCTPRLFSSCAVAGASLLLAVGPVRGQTSGSGFVEGNLTIFPLSDINRSEELAGDSNRKTTLANYADFPLVILTSDGQKEVKRFTANSEGHYRVALPPGNYILDIQDRVQKHVRAKPQIFAVQSGETSKINIALDTGIR
jgi:hypothetical protein